jgi:hypothetical protein
MSSKRRGELTPQELHEARRRAKHTAYLKATGKPVIINPDEAATLMAHVQALAATGMSGRAIAAQSGVSATAVNGIIRGVRSRAFRTNYEALMRVRPDPLTVYGPREGKPMPVWPARRRLQALAADGFPYTFLSHTAGMRSYRNSQWYRIINGYDCHMTSPYYINLAAELFSKLAGTKPEDYGLSHRQIARTLTIAKRGGFAPSWCWDWDTIDMEDAQPEWTGRCGTMKGYRLHVVHGITPVCDACYRAQFGRGRTGG